MSVLHSGLRVKLFGVPALFAADRAVTLSPSATMVCAYLALAPSEGRSRALAAVDLFPDCPSPVARRRLNTALWRLRSEARASAGVELLDPGDTYWIRLSPSANVDVDLRTFEDLISATMHVGVADVGPRAAARLEDAIAMRRGQLLEPCLHDWVLPDRYRAENLYLVALDLLVQYHGERSDVAAVTKYGELALDLEPLREDVHRHLMAAYGAAGRVDLVERQFERCRMLLVEELGADPMPETIALYSRLTRGEGGERSASVAALIAELDRARRDVARLAEVVDRVIDRLSYLP